MPASVTITKVYGTAGNRHVEFSDGRVFVFADIPEIRDRAIRKLEEDDELLRLMHILRLVRKGATIANGGFLNKTLTLDFAATPMISES